MTTAETRARQQRHLDEARKFLGLPPRKPAPVKPFQQRTCPANRSHNVFFGPDDRCAFCHRTAYLAWAKRAASTNLNGYFTRGHPWERRSGNGRQQTGAALMPVSWWPHRTHW